MNSYEFFVAHSFITYSRNSLSVDYFNFESGSLNKAFCIDLRGDIAEIPAFLVNESKKALNAGCTELISPITNLDWELPIKKNNFSALASSSIINSIGKTVSIKDYLYYSCPGMIMDNNLNILFMTTMMLNTTDQSITEYRCRISKKLYEDMESPVAKLVHTKLLPLYATYQVTRMNGSFDVDIIIDTMPDIIIKTEEPSAENTNNEVLNDIIYNHINDKVLC